MKRYNLVQFVFKSACFSRKQNLQFQNSFIFIFKHQTNDGIFLNKTGENFNLTKIFWDVGVRL